MAELPLLPAAASPVLIRNGDVFCPEGIGRADVLVAFGKVVAIDKDIRLDGQVAEIDAGDCYVCPGLIDQHVHFAGGAGRGGPSFRAPEISAQQFFAAGITTAVGCRGMDETTRNFETLLVKARALRAEGMTALLYTGGISHPPKSLTGDVFRDLLLVEEMIGLKTSVAEDCAGRVDFETLLRLSGLARCGGEMGGKTGLLHVHLGGIVAEMDVLFRLIEEQRDTRHIVVTHVNMSEGVLARSREFASRGGHIDFTAVQNPALNRHGSVKASRAIAKVLEAGVPPDLISISSDSVGVVTPPENERAARSHFGPEILLNELRDLVLDEGFPLARALPSVTTNPARLLGLDPKGRLVVGGDADVALFDRRLRTRHLIARGTLVYGDPASRA